MITLIVLYILTLIIFSIFTFYNKGFKSLTNFLLVFQFLVFLIPIKRFILNITKEGISIYQLMIIALFPIMIYLFILWSNKRKMNFFKEFVTTKLRIALEKGFEQLVFFNKHTFYLSNKYLPKIEIWLRPFLIKSPYIFLFYLTFFSNFIIICVTIIEYTFFYKIKIAWIMLLFNFFLFRLLKVSLFYIMQISLNSVNYHFNQILFRTHLPSVEKEEEGKENIFRLFSDDLNLKGIFFLDKNYEKDYLLNKFFILKSILHFSSMYLSAFF